MENLIEQLTAATQDVKNAFIEQTKIWAEQEHANQIQRTLWTAYEYCEYFGLTPEKYTFANGTSYEMPRGFYRTKNSVTMHRMKTEANRAKRMTTAEYIDRAIKKAIQHYENSVAKLADRIQKKGLNMDSVKVENASVGANLNATITDGDKVVRAFTIIASGLVQKPHYRYLIH